MTLDSVTLAYGPRVVLSDVSLRVEAGEVVALIGPNGAGKSTLVRAASGVLAPRSGRVDIDGTDLRRLRPEGRARRVAVVPQAARLPEAFTALDTVLMGRSARLGWLGRESEADREAARDSLRRTLGAELEDRRLGELSGGEQQLVLIARALAQGAPVLLLDEPTAQLDLRHQSAVMGLVRDLARREGLAVMVAIHDLNLAARFADRVGLLGGGRLAALGRPGEVLTVENVSEAYGVRVGVHDVGGRLVVLPEVTENGHHGGTEARRTHGGGEG